MNTDVISLNKFIDDRYGDDNIKDGDIEKMKGLDIWTKRSSGTTSGLIDITYGNSLFVAVGISGIILTSPDGITWTSRTSNTSNNLYGITYGNGLFVAVGGNGTGSSSIILTCDY